MPPVKASSFNITSLDPVSTNDSGRKAYESEELSVDCIEWLKVADDGIFSHSETVEPPSLPCCTSILSFRRYPRNASASA
jgi:hypothetical protein